MKRILKIGMDVHSTNYTLCAVEPKLDGEPEVLLETQVEPEYQKVIDFIEKLKKRFKKDRLIITCGYEAGCLGYTLYHQLESKGVHCVILAPSTMLAPSGRRIKTDKRDALMIAKCLASGGYSAVYIPTKTDEDVREYLRMRDDHKLALKKIKQQINAFCLRNGYKYSAGKWTTAHIKWLNELDFSELEKEVLDEYLVTYRYLTDKIERFDVRIEELAAREEYREKVSKLCCFIGIKKHAALSLIVETGDFSRFAKGNVYAAYLGMVPGESSSSDNINRTGITKAGNKHARVLLIEAAQGICKGKPGYKSKDLKARQQGNSAEVIAYADKGNERLRRKYYKLIFRGKQRNVAVAAVARELACFVWGMMTDNIV